jgi:WhiB family transcriptional regulator, redox-sensing transcriptional regulator
VTVKAAVGLGGMATTKRPRGEGRADDAYLRYLGTPQAPDWSGAACLGKGANDEWFPTSKQDDKLAAALAVCATCPITEDCLEYGLTQDAGIWGGLSEHEIRKLRRARHRQERRQPINHGTGTKGGAP